MTFHRGGGSATGPVSSGNFVLRRCLTLLWLSVAPYAQSTWAGDLSYVPLFNGERSDSLNLWGGPFTAGNISSIAKQATIVRSGSAAYQANLGSVPAGGFKFFQTFSSQVTGFQAYRQDRDLNAYQTLEGYVRNESGAPVTFSVEIKDYRDSNGMKATRSYTVPVGGWTKIDAPLDLGSGWNVTGTPDLSRTYALGFLVNADYGAATGSLYLDDFALIEKGPSIDPATAPIESVVERLAQRQFHGLWSARNKSSGLIPNTSNNVAIGALNTTAGVAWMLPSAVRRGWVSQSAADSYMTQLVGSLNANRNQTAYLPTRFLDFATAAPVTDREESSIDAAFIALALHSYKSQPATPQPLRDSISSLEDRFNFSAFVTPGAFNQAYWPATGFSPYTYSGYTHENKVISLAAEVNATHHVPLASMWNKDTGRTLAYLVDQNDRFLTYSFGTDYRAPFAQALINLFVDTSERGVDNYPTRSLARNTWLNFVKQEDEVGDKLAQLGRANFFQADAGQGAAGYQPYNMFNNFGQPNLFMPWSAAFALMANANGAEDALRFLLDNGLGNGLDGPLGLADSAQWANGAPNPTSVPSFADNWNMVLSTMALLEFLDGDDGLSSFFAGLPGVKAALDTVFLDGDLNGDGLTNPGDLGIWRNGAGVAALASPANGDADGDGDVDGNDFLRWQRGLNVSGSLIALESPVPEPTGWASAVIGAIVATGRIRRKKNL